MFNEKDLENLRKQYNIVKILAWISIVLLILAMTFAIIGYSHANDNSAVHSVANHYSSLGGINVSGSHTHNIDKDDEKKSIHK